jgi:hypothetical protein
MASIDDSAPRRESDRASVGILELLRFLFMFGFLLIGHISLAACNNLNDHSAFVTDAVAVVGTLQRHSHLIILDDSTPHR